MVMNNMVVERSGGRFASGSRPAPDNLAIHYVGYTAVGEVQAASISMLQKPLLHLYSEFLKTGGCTARKERNLVFTDNCIRIRHPGDDNEENEQYFHYALITYTNTVVLRTFKSHGKKLYGMFEPTTPISFTTDDRPETLFPLEKRFSKVDNIPIFPLVAMLYRPDPPNNHLHCHAFACINIEQSNQVFSVIQARVHSFFEDYETLSVDANMFSSPVPDFWKLTEDGWRMTMTRKKKRVQPEEEEEESEHEEEIEEDQNTVSEMRRHSQDLAVFAQSKILTRKQSNGDLFSDARVPNSDSGVESPTAESPELKPVTQSSPRANRERPKYVRGGVRVLPAPPQSAHGSLSSPELVRRGPPVAPKPKTHRLKSTDSPQEESSTHEYVQRPPPVAPPTPNRPLQHSKKNAWKSEPDIARKSEQTPPRKSEQTPTRKQQHTPNRKPEPDVVRRPEPTPHKPEPPRKPEALKPKPKELTRTPIDDSDIWKPLHPEPKPKPSKTHNKANDYIKPEPKIEERPMEEWEWEEVGEPTTEPGNFSRGKAIRRPSEPRPKSPEPPPLQRSKAIRKVSDSKKEQRRPNKQLSFEGPVLMTKSDSFKNEENKKTQKQESFSSKDSEIELILTDMVYANGIDGVERSASMMNFERSLGYLP